MKYFNILFGVFLFTITSFAHSTVINDVKTFDKIYNNGEILHWEYELADYGFVLGRDTLIGRPLLTIELRDPNYWPEKDWSEQPFLMIVIDQERHFTRVSNEDWSERSFFNENGIMPVNILFDSIDVWLGDVTLNIEFTPGPTQAVQEPAPFILIAIGLLALGLGRYRYISHREKER